MSTQTVKEFVQDSYRIVTSGSPTVPLHGDDMSKGVQYLNELLSSYSSSGLITTIAKLVETELLTNVAFVKFVQPSFVVPIPVPNNTIYIKQGRLSNLENAWIRLDGLDYPIFDESRNVFFGSYKFFPLSGLPRYCIVTNNVDMTTMQIYPKPSQFYELFIYGKFELNTIDKNGNMAQLPSYETKFLRLALARELCIYKSRQDAWTDKLEKFYEEAYDAMTSVSTSNLVIASDDESYLNGSWRVRAGV